jgi:hypothetical protein
MKGQSNQSFLPEKGRLVAGQAGLYTGKWLGDPLDWLTAGQRQVTQITWAKPACTRLAGCPSHLLLQRLRLRTIDFMLDMHNSGSRIAHGKRSRAVCLLQDCAEA